MGNKTNPSPKLLTGDEGSKQLVAVKNEGEKGLSAYFEGQKGMSKVLSADGMPPLPVTFGRVKAKDYKVDEEQSYEGA